MITNKIEIQFFFLGRYMKFMKIDESNNFIKYTLADLFDYFQQSEFLSWSTETRFQIYNRFSFHSFVSMV